MATKKEQRCWPGYEAVPGKAQNEKGSCRKKPESKLTPSEKEFRAARKKQIDKWQADHPGSPRSAAQGLKKPKAPKAKKK